MKKKGIKHEIINIGTGYEHTIKDYLNLLVKILKPIHKFKIKYDKTKPNGIKRKILNSSLANSYGWRPKHDLIKSLQKTVLFFNYIR